MLEISKSKKSYSSLTRFYYKLKLKFNQTLLVWLVLMKTYILNHQQFLEVHGGQKWSSGEMEDEGILKGEVSLYCWPPVWLVWDQLYDNW